MIDITAQLAIPEEELIFESVRGGGPGGQKVNKTASKIVLTFQVYESESLSEFQRRRIIEKLASRISQEGLLRIEVQSERSLQANRRVAIERFVNLLQYGLHRDAPRKPTKKTRASQRRRIDEKKRKGKTKRDRGKKDWND